MQAPVAPEQQVQITFADNSLGFDPAKASSDVFVLCKRFHICQNGRGMGLYFLKIYVEAMGVRTEVSTR